MSFIAKLKSGWATVTDKLSKWWQWFNEKTQCDGSPMTDEMPHYTHCMNCGTQLEGMFCHKCGQHALMPEISIWGLVKEYIKNILAIERQALSSFINLIFQPGRLTTEFCAGRYVSYLHPLKFHLFLLLVLLSLFAFFGTDAKIEGSFRSLTHRNEVIAGMTLSSVTTDTTYAERLANSGRDTITMIVPHLLVKDYPSLIDVIDIVGLDEEKINDTMVLTMPSVLIEDQVVVEEQGYYQFASDNHFMTDVMMLDSIADGWEAMTSRVFSHFPLIILLTTPFLTFAIRLILRRKPRPRIYTYIFSLHYIAFIEVLLIALYLGGVIFGYTYYNVQGLVTLLLLIHLTAALHKAYEISTWWRSAIAALLINTIYYLLCLITISIACLVVIAVYTYSAWD